MKLSRVQLSCPEQQLEVDLSFVDETGAVRPTTWVYGGPGIGKTLLLSAIAHTRPGHTVAFNQAPGEPRVMTRCHWLPGLDEPDRRAPLELATPSTLDELGAAAAERRREAAFFDRLAREGGFVFVVFSALRWFSNAPLLLSAPERTLARHEVRAHEPLGDATRHDWTRATLAALTYAEASARVGNKDLCDEDHELLCHGMRRAVGAALAPFGVRYLGLHPRTLEATFERGNQRLSFYQLPTQLKNVVAIAAAVVRALWAGYPGLNPLSAQGVVAIDQIELHIDAQQCSAWVNALSEVLPHVQWLLTTRSAELLALRDPAETIVLRRATESGAVQIFSGEGARIH